MIYVKDSAVWGPQVTGHHLTRAAPPHQNASQPCVKANGCLEVYECSADRSVTTGHLVARYWGTFRHLLVTCLITVTRGAPPGGG